LAQGYIYTVDANGDLHRMTPSAPENEDRMQALVELKRAVDTRLRREVGAAIQPASPDR